MVPKLGPLTHSPPLLGAKLWLCVVFILSLSTTDKCKNQKENSEELIGNA